MRQIKFLGLALVFLLAVPGLCWAQNALIVQDGTAGIEADAMGNLTAKLTAAGYTVTNNVGVPGGSLATYGQIWDIRFNNTTPLTPADITAYTTYLAGGGALFVMGENTGFATRNVTIASFISALGGGSVFVTNPANNTQTVHAPFTGPNAITTITFLAAAAIQTPPGTGTFVTVDSSGLAAAVVFPPHSLASAPTGTLIAVFDVNFLQAGADANSQAFASNLIAFLAAPTPLGGTGRAIPTLSFWGMVLLAAAVVAIGIGFLARRL